MTTASQLTTHANPAHANSAQANQPQFSVVIPAYNAARDIEACLKSLLAQQFDLANYEIIVVDDYSTDATFELASTLAASHANLHIVPAPVNAGPGIARNLGVAQARGEWVIFLDSDDTLANDALLKLQTYIRNQGDDVDAIGYNWAFTPLSNLSAEASASTQSLPASGRRDQAALSLSKIELLKEYLSLHMDGSVIYTAVRRRLITENGLAFAAGYHEDVDYIYLVYWHARRIAYLDEVLYFKGWRADSIVNTISLKHIQGFMRAWAEIGRFTKAHSTNWDSMSGAYQAGLAGAVATRAREIYRRASTQEQAATLYAALHTGLHEDFSWLSGAVESLLTGTLPDTKYVQIANRFIRNMQDSALSAMQKEQSISLYIGDIMNKSWSCIDLHHSVFLAPDQIRTCCKRFFVDGEMRGDVSLMDVPELNATPITPARILKAKQTLHNKINAGEKSGCSGCPFLEFKEWGALDKLEVKYLSFEYHSVCNLKCSYCSDTYFGGKQANYDVKR
ncbi:MAG: glycosyltransferase family 2 protein, partial [Methylophilaceae bacterium]